jgi:hypothetical protein
MVSAPEINPRQPLSCTKVQWLKRDRPRHAGRVRPSRRRAPTSNGGGNVFRISLAGPLAIAGLACTLGATPVLAQLVEVKEHRYEFTPFAGYQWGGSFETDAGGGVPAGELSINDSFAWGAILGFILQRGSAIELTYLRQDSDLDFKSLSGTRSASWATNYVQIGGRQEFGSGTKLHPFLLGSLGIGIFDLKQEGFGSETRFSWSVGGGAIYRLNSDRVAIRAESRLWITPVPSGDYATWCDFYGCFVAEGTAWVTQGQVTGGLMFSF